MSILSPKIAENSDHNIDPWNELSCSFVKLIMLVSFSGTERSGAWKSILSAQITISGCGIGFSSPTLFTENKN
jgi:hypothetical protein